MDEPFKRKPVKETSGLVKPKSQFNKVDNEDLGSDDSGEADKIVPIDFNVE